MGSEYDREEDVVLEDEPVEDEGEDEPISEVIEVKESKGEGSNSIVLMCLGCLIFPTSLFFLGWNEKTTLCQSKALIQAESDSIIAECDDADPVQGQFAFFSCPINTATMTEFTPMSFNTPGLKELIKFKSVAASQKLEMYQCIETVEEREVDDSWMPSKLLEETSHQFTNVSSLMRIASDTFTRETRRRRTGIEAKNTITTYKYKMGWTDVHYDSTAYKGTPENIRASGCPDFIHDGKPNHNPQAPDRGDGEKVSLGTQIVHATSVSAGAYTFVDDKGMQIFDTNQTLSLSPWKDGFGLPATTDNILTRVASDGLAVHADSDTYLSSCAHERLGCIRISYNSSSASYISVMGKVGSSGNIEPYTMDKSWGCGGDGFMRMYPTEMTKEDFIAEMQKENSARTWGIRVVCLLFCWLSVWCCLEPIASAAEAVGGILWNIPIIGEALASLLEGVVDFMICFMACGCGCSCGLLVIAIVWIAMRPAVGGPLLGGAFVLLVSAVVAHALSPRDAKRTRARKQIGYGTGYGATAPAGEAMIYA